MPICCGPEKGPPPMFFFFMVFHAPLMTEIFWTSERAALYFHTSWPLFPMIWTGIYSIVASQVSSLQPPYITYHIYNLSPWPCKVETASSSKIGLHSITTDKFIIFIHVTVKTSYLRRSNKLQEWWYLCVDMVSMITSRGKFSTQRKTCSTAILSTTNPIPELNPCLRYEKSVGDYLSYSMATGRAELCWVHCTKFEISSI
jgi:hypothetical protein